jgi:RimJ/RimL family protein N-acetyltransferase
VLQTKGQGFGRAALRVAKRVVFDDLGAHRFWLDVKQRNARAQAFYDSEGFVIEGTLREAVRTRLEDGKVGYDSLVVWSMLRSEFAARRAQGLELMS